MIHYVWICDDSDLKQFTNQLDQLLTKNMNISLIVFDTLTLLIRISDFKQSDKNKLISEICADLVKIAHDHNVAIVITNQMKRWFVDGNPKPMLENYFTEYLFQHVTNWVMMRSLSEWDSEYIRADLIEKHEGEVVKL